MDLYGIEYISSIVRNLHQIVDEVLRFGNLTNTSSYVFENCLFGLKRNRIEYGIVISLWNNFWDELLNLI